MGQPNNYLMYVEGYYDKSTKTSKWAFTVIKQYKLIHEEYGSIKNSTVNEAYVTGLMYAVRYCQNLQEGYTVRIYCSNKYVVESYNKRLKYWTDTDFKEKTVKHYKKWSDISKHKNDKIKVSWIKGDYAHKFQEYTYRLTYKGDVERTVNVVAPQKTISIFRGIAYAFSREELLEMQDIIDEEFQRRNQEYEGFDDNLSC